MRRAPGAVMFAIVVFCAAPVHAQGWRWLEKLSGPGNFTGFEVDVKLLCRYEEPAPTLAPRAIPGVSLPCVKKLPPLERTSEETESVNAIVKTDSGTFDLAQRRYAIGAAVSYLRGGSSLQYAAADADRTVQVWTIEGFFDHQARRPRSWLRRVEYGVAAGANIFVAPEADTFVRWSVEPRLTIKLFDLHKRGEVTYLGRATLRLGVLAFFGEFLAEDFGAIPGTYRSGDSVEFGPSVRFILDFDRNPFK